MNKNTVIIDKLLKAGAAPNATQRTGETPFMACVRTGDEAAVRVLLAHGADVSTRDKWAGQTALMWAAGNKHAGVLRLLIEHRADVNARSNGAFTPLMFASQQGDLESVQALLATGAQINEYLKTAEPDLQSVDSADQPSAKSIHSLTRRYNQKEFRRMVEQALSAKSPFDRNPRPSLSERLKSKGLYGTLEAKLPEIKAHYDLIRTKEAEWKSGNETNFDDSDQSFHVGALSALLRCGTALKKLVNQHGGVSAQSTEILRAIDRQIRRELGAISADRVGLMIARASIYDLIFFAFKIKNRSVNKSLCHEVASAICSGGGGNMATPNSIKRAVDDTQRPPCFRGQGVGIPVRVTALFQLRLIAFFGRYNNTR